jgi:hypothetical protein
MFLRLPPEHRMAYTGPLPWGYVRAKLAERWGILPRQVDEEPATEVALALRLAGIEAEESRG